MTYDEITKSPEYIALVRKLSTLTVSAYCRGDLDTYQSIVAKMEEMESLAIDA